MNWQRARGPDQKEQRRQQILTAGAQLFEEEGFEPVSLNGIAKRAGMAKANVYRYFESKEAIFLELYRSDVNEWFDDACEALGELNRAQGDPRAVAATLAESVARHTRLVHLIPMTAAALERNISEEMLIELKRGLLASSDRLIREIRHHLPELSKEQGIEILFTLHALVSGLWPMANMTPTMRRVVSRPELAAFDIEFKAYFQKALTRVIVGCLHEPLP